MRICTVVGARPQFVKAAAVSPALKAAGIQETLVHTGQHYDANLSSVFFDELGIPSPHINLEVGSGTHARQTGAMMARLESFLDESPSFDAILLYGDTNSTLAGALVAAKVHLPIAHVEAGLRSFNRTMPEEVNRVVTDCLSHWLFAPTQGAVDNLAAEGLSRGTSLVGDVMLDATRMFAARARERFPLAKLSGLAPGSYALATVHRPSNTDFPECLARIFAAFGQLEWPVLLPLHPRTKARMGGIRVPPNVRILEPVSYLTMLTLVEHALCPHRQRRAAEGGLLAQGAVRHPPQRNRMDSNADKRLECVRGIGRRSHRRGSPCRPFRDAAPIRRGAVRRNGVRDHRENPAARQRPGLMP